jgi:hypothetical protein
VFIFCVVRVSLCVYLFLCVRACAYVCVRVFWVYFVCPALRSPV